VISHSEIYEMTFAIFLLKWIRLTAIGLLNKYRAYKKFRIVLPLGSHINSVANITIGTGFGFSQGCMLFAQDEPGVASIDIGDNVKCNFNVMINADCGGRIRIGNNVLLGPGVMMRASNHAYGDNTIPIIEQGHSAGVIVIEDNVWIGANVVVLPGVTIASGSIIAAGSLVNKSVPANMIYGGIPAAFIKTR